MSMRKIKTVFTNLFRRLAGIGHNNRKLRCNSEGTIRVSPVLRQKIAQCVRNDYKSEQSQDGSLRQ